MMATENMKGETTMKSFLQQAITGSKADFIEVRLEDTSKTGISYSGKDLKKAQCTRDYGGYIRVLIDGSWGFVSFNDPDALTELVRLEERALAAGPGTTKLAKVKPVEDVIPLKMDPDSDPREVSLEEKVGLFRRISSAILESSPTIISSGVRLY